ncbi:hypothetical protein POPTR_007G044750v4 [Populus trichocarpa]|uniref:Uncharacterized protein n=1 Tax=Populus trichocarpa TaxID=3694 RepID=A0ACC0SPE1_POPTR|nr:hypothetical protein POPTR_007G044750v4 [Populus trichocarpa]
MLHGHLFIHLFFTILLLGCFLTFILRDYLKIAVPIRRVDFLSSDFRPRVLGVKPNLTPLTCSFHANVFAFQQSTDKKH